MAVAPASPRAAVRPGPLPSLAACIPERQAFDLPLSILNRNVQARPAVRNNRRSLFGVAPPLSISD
jgi:hypothetical protein